ncbi:MAG TPA: response regulator [Kofleriaceae bacterium]|nr:response regulator [Kofleriaceae bacterium]
MSSSAEGRTILVVHGERKTQRAVHRILGSTACEIDTVADAAEGLRAIHQRAPALIVLDYRMATGEAGLALAHAAARAGTRACLLLVGESDPGDVPKLFEHGALTNLLAHPMPILAEELAVTAMKLLSGDIFGLEKYLAWGAEPRVCELVDAAERAEVVEAFADDVRGFGLGPRVASMATLVADELLSNALFDAPVDDEGRRFRAGEPRGRSRPLAGRERVLLRYACDARYLALEVTDLFGTLQRETIVEYLARAARRGAGDTQVDLEGTGAGMGIALSYSCCTHLVYNLSWGHRTQVIALIDLRFKPGARSPVASFNVFVEEAAA